MEAPLICFAKSLKALKYLEKKGFLLKDAKRFDIHMVFLFYPYYFNDNEGKNIVRYMLENGVSVDLLAYKLSTKDAYSYVKISAKDIFDNMDLKEEQKIELRDLGIMVQ
jgi:hypothetical protein